jgi:cathepsin D
MSEITGKAIIGSSSGIMGFGWTALAESKATPFWQSAFNSSTNGNDSSSEFGLFIQRLHNPFTQSEDDSEEPGGTLTLGGVNTTFYSGDIEFLNLTTSQVPGQPDFWTLNLASASIPTVQPIFSNTLILQASPPTERKLSFPRLPQLRSILEPLSYRGPRTMWQHFGRLFLALDLSMAKDMQASTDIVSTLSATVPSSADTQCPEACSTELKVTMSFGGSEWPISETDINAGQLTDGGSECAGSIFAAPPADPSDGTPYPAWVVGDTLLVRSCTSLRLYL